MKQAHIIFRFLFPSRQDATKPIHPTMGAFDHPTSCFETGLPFNGLSFFSAGFDVRRIAKLFDQITHRVIIIPFIQTHPLPLSLVGLGTLYRNTFQCGFNQLAIMAIRSLNGQANRYPMSFRQQTSFHALFGPIRRVWAGFSPHLTGFWSWPRPWIARTNQCLLAHRNLPKPSPKVSGIRRLGSPPGTASGRCYWNKYRFRSGHSTDNRFSGQKRCRPGLDDPAHEACRHQNDACFCAWAAVVQFSSIIRPKSDSGWFFFVCSSLNPFKGTIAFVSIGHSGVIRIGSKCLYS